VLVRMNALQRLSLIGFALLTGCQSRSKGPQSQAIAVDSTWRRHDVAGTPLTVLLPAKFRKRNDYGCFDDDPRSGQACSLDIRVVCIFLTTGGLKNAPRLSDNGCTLNDCAFYEDVETQSLSLGTRPAIIQRGLVTAGVMLRERVPTVLVNVAVTPDSVAGLNFTVRSFDDVPLVTLVATSVDRKSNR
jgi:hypothetical protein